MDELRDTQYNLPIGTDCISRQAAIDEIKYELEMIDSALDSITLDFNARERLRQRRGEAREILNSIQQLPPAQPEIVRCKDCKHWIPYDWMFSEVWRSKNMADYPEDEIGCNWCDMAMKAVDFCSRAERRKVTNGN